MMPHDQYPAAAVATALYIAGGIRGMERGTVSEQRESDGTERFAELELLRLAVPRRVYTLSQLKYVADRVKWVWDNRELIGDSDGQWSQRCSVFLRQNEGVGSHWQEDPVVKFKEDFGDSL